VTIATAWSGFQAAKWEGQQSRLYGEASRDRFQASDAANLGGQLLLSDVTLFSGWLQARSAGDIQLQALYIRRFSPGYRDAFNAWLATDPFNNPQAPPGPSAMPQYHNLAAEQAKQLNDQASATFDQGTDALETAEEYVRDTVLFASVLFLVAIAQRFETRPVRIGANVVAFAVLIFVLVSLVVLPRL
jgi:hypothetical protein